MGFEIARIRTELQGAPLASPYPLDLAIAVVNDTFRMAAIVPVPAKQWKAWASARKGLWPEQMGMLAHLLTSTSLRTETVRALQPRRGQVDLAAALTGFFDAIAPLTAEMIRANAFRQEELVRKWADAMGGTIEGETEAQSKKKREQLDYRKALTDFEQAEAARKAEAARRAKLLAEAAAKEAEARGWRE